jgi:hypothetical protein
VQPRGSSGIVSESWRGSASCARSVSRGDSRCVFRGDFRVILCKHAVVFPELDQATPTRCRRAHALHLGADAGPRVSAVHRGRGHRTGCPHPWPMVARQSRDGGSAGGRVAVSGRRGALPTLCGDAFHAAGLQSHPTCTPGGSRKPRVALDRTRPRGSMALRDVQQASARARERLASCDRRLVLRIATGPGRHIGLKPSSPTDRSAPYPAPLPPTDSSFLSVVSRLE